MTDKYLKLLSQKYPDSRSVASEIINLNAIKSLPKGTEYFFSDLHGEYISFLHLLKSASGMIMSKINIVFGKSLSSKEREALAFLIYYPEQTIKKESEKGNINDDWRKVTIYRLIQVCNCVSAKYTRSRVRKRMPKEYAYIIDELLNVTDDINKDFYYDEIIRSILETKTAEDFIISLCYLIQRLSIDFLHIIGDIFDRGPRPDIIVDELIKFESVDIQWGNHDVSWMGAAAGNKALIANVIRIALSYNSFDLLEDGYGINLRALSVFADKYYKNDNCEKFAPHMLDSNIYDNVDANSTARMHKAITIIQLKLESQLISRHPEYEMNHRNILPIVDFRNYTVNIGGQMYKLNDTNFPTINPDAPAELCEDEKELMDVLCISFRHSSILQKHIKFIYSYGSMYKVCNQNLMFHGCIPMDESGNFLSLNINGRDVSGKELLDACNDMAIKSYYSKKNSQEKKNANDFMWYLWCGSKSPLYGKNKMAFFEKYFIDDKSLTKEIYNPYFRLYDDHNVFMKIFDEFGISRKKGHIINGHVPVKLKDGESPIKANGKVFVIDGGISKAYQSKTGIAGYTLIYSSHALQLAEHTPFIPGQKQKSPVVRDVEIMPERINIADTDVGKELSEQITDLEKLLKAYKNGDISSKYGTDVNK